MSHCNVGFTTVSNSPCWQMESFDAPWTAYLQMSPERKKQHPSEGILSFKKLKYQVWYGSCHMLQLQITAPWKILVGLVCSRPGYATPYKVTKNKRKAKINHVNNTIRANLFLKSELLKVRECKVVKSLVDLIKRFSHVVDAKLDIVYNVSHLY